MITVLQDPWGEGIELVAPSLERIALAAEIRTASVRTLAGSASATGATTRQASIITTTIPVSEAVSMENDLQSYSQGC